MKYYVILICLLSLCLLIPQAALSIDVYRSWFTDASATDFTNHGYTSAAITKPSSAPSPVAGGTRGNCFDMSALSTDGYNATVGSMAVANTSGAISFWIRPTEDGKLTSGGTEHTLLRAGTPDSNGMQVSWDNAKGTFRFKMTGKNGTAAKTTVCRADISSWKANDWHHIQVAWVVYDGPVPSGKTAGRGLALWIDRTAVASEILGGTAFMSNPSSNYVKVGSTSAKCYMDELIFRRLDNGSVNNSTLDIAYKDFYLTAPYESIAVTYMPFGDSDPYSTAEPKEVISIPSDNWVLAGKQKQYGLIGTRILNTATPVKKMKEYLTNYDKGGWLKDFDAKPSIAWSLTNAPSGTSIDSSGLVTAGTTTGSPAVNATFRSGTGALSTNLTTAVKACSSVPDLGIQWVSRTPKYDKYGAQKWPNAGQTVTTTVYYGNFGTANVTATYSIKFERAIDANNNFRLDSGETWSTIATNSITADINAGVMDRTSSCTWTWPSTNPLTTGSVFIKVTLDSGNAVANEICDVNNIRCEKSNARSYHWGYHAEDFSSWWTNRDVNLVGSFSGYDWYNAQVDRVNIMIRTTACNTVPAGGIQDDLRVDNFVAWNGDDAAPYYDEWYLYESGMPERWLGGLEGDITLMDVDGILAHEMGHNALALPDLYGGPMSVYNVLLGTSYGGGVLFPIVANIGPDESQADKTGMWSTHTFGYQDEMGTGYTPLMEGCHWWLSPYEAGRFHHMRQQRQDLYDDYVIGDRAPRGTGKNKIQFYAIDDTPLKSARVWLYQTSNTGMQLTTVNKYFPNWPKFAGATDTNGVFTIPTTTATSWDDYTTDNVEKAVSCTMPFDLADGSPPMPEWMYGDFMLVKVTGKNPRSTSNNMEEFHLIPMIDLCSAYYKNGGDPNIAGVYTIRTSLAAVNGPGASTPTAQTLTTNYPPELNVTVTGADSVTYGDIIDVTVGTNQTITIHSGATDGEGQPLYYWWMTPWGALYGGTSYNTSFSDPGEYWFSHFVIDGVRYCCLKEICVIVN